MTGLYPFSMLRLCSASLRGIPIISEGCQAKISQFSRRYARNVASIFGSSYAPMDVAFVEYVGWTWNLTISSASLKEVDLGRLSSITLSLSTVSTTRLILQLRGLQTMPRGPRRRFFSVQSAMSRSLARVMIPLGPGILSFMYP